ESEQSDQATSQNWHIKTTTPLNGKKKHGKNNNKQKPPNTLLSSQTTRPPGRATSPRHLAAYS
ncbi:hypothetical protein, partial [Mycobacterium sp.]|uniref:hypothetical protein n=1 Tax=Mycobacterium sp. TaxID=1785 RepID=UPI002D85546C|nr:hypothetical protein [Mycobacterium sp.]